MFDRSKQASETLNSGKVVVLAARPGWHGRVPWVSVDRPKPAPLARLQPLAVLLLLPWIALAWLLVFIALSAAFLIWLLAVGLWVGAAMIHDAVWKVAVPWLCTPFSALQQRTLGLTAR